MQLEQTLLLLVPQVLLVQQDLLGRKVQLARTLPYKDPLVLQVVRGRLGLQGLQAQLVLIQQFLGLRVLRVYRVSKVPQEQQEPRLLFLVLQGLLALRGPLEQLDRQERHLQFLDRLALRGPQEILDLKALKVLKERLGLLEKLEPKDLRGFKDLQEVLGPLAQLGRQALKGFKESKDPQAQLEVLELRAQHLPFLGLQGLLARLGLQVRQGLKGPLEILALQEQAVLLATTARSLAPLARQSPL